jgi:signal transduction histidine kinase
MSVFMTFAARAKAGGWWKNTVVYKVLVLLGRFFRWLGRGVRYVFRNLPLCWKGALVWCGLCLVELIFMAACSGDTGRFAAWWLLGRVILTAAVVLTLIALRKLQKGGEALAKGDLRYQIDLRHLYGDLKAHGENLNSIAGGMQKAVDEQLRAERFKTELITNVSHDIKTPLTSIVNYVDLMKKEDLQPEKAKEYLAVLDRQSARLKKLTEDLVEASKASTGAMPVALGRTDLNVLLSQVAGEYDDRLRAAGLEPVLTLCPAMPAVLADGKLLWRVFDNLLGNICKYALPGTRVYLETRAESGKAVVSFKNVSKYALNISSSELMERFVRGDSSRSTEGSGLGLSIAQSLTQLQGGEFQLVIDGDLFKALVSFGALPPETT